MSITVEFSSPEEEAAFKARAEAAGLRVEDYARQALSQMLASEQPLSLQDELSAEEWIRQFRSWAQGHDRTTPLLSDEAVSRASFYPDRV